MSKEQSLFNQTPKYQNGNNKMYNPRNLRGASFDQGFKKYQAEQIPTTPQKIKRNVTPLIQKKSQDQTQSEQQQFFQELQSPQTGNRQQQVNSLNIANESKKKKNSFPQKKINSNIQQKIKQSKDQPQQLKIAKKLKEPNKIQESPQNKMKLGLVQLKQNPAIQNQVIQQQKQKIESKTNLCKNKEKIKETQAIIQNKKQELLKVDKQQEYQPLDILTPRQQTSKLSFSPKHKPCKTQRSKSPNLQQKIQTQKLAAFSSVTRPIFKDAKYYITPLIHFLREQYFPQTTPYKLQFQIEFSDQQYYFKQKFCDHYLASFSNVKKCQILKQKSRVEPIYLNPPKQPKLSKSHIKTIIFDLDETLIYCNDVNNNPTDHEATIQVPNEPAYNIRFNIRPNCIEMLQILSQYYELILFTASFKEYADKILEFIDPQNNIFAYRFYRENCVSLEGDLFVKDLSVIQGRKLEHMVLVDNSAQCYFFQPNNGIPIIPFEENKKDKELIFLTDYLIKCEKCSNWLEMHKCNFKNFIHFQSETFDTCLRRII